MDARYHIALNNNDYSVIHSNYLLKGTVHETFCYGSSLRLKQDNHVKLQYPWFLSSCRAIIFWFTSDITF